MRTSVMATVLTILALTGIDPKASGQEPTADERFAGLVEWFDGLGFETAVGLEFGRVCYGSESSGGETHSLFRHGFQVEALPDGVLLLDGWEQVRLAGREGSPEPTGRFEPLNFGDWIRQSLSPLENAPVENFGPFRGFYTTRSSRVELCLYAWRAAKRGMADESRRLFQAAERVVENWGNRSRVSILEGLKRDIAESMTWDLFLACDSPEPTRKSLLADARRILEHFPGSEHESKVRDLHDALVQMVAEDAAHALRPQREIDRLPKSEQIAELIHRLRDQDGAQWSQPGSCEILGPWGNDQSDTPAHRLIEFGLDAVPAVLAILEDRRLTRSVGYHRNFYFSHHVLRYGDCAVEILERIAGRTFYTPASTSSYLLRDGDVPAVRKQIEDWYAQAREGGLERSWLQAVEQGGSDAASAAGRLLEIDAQKHIEAVIAAARRETKQWPRARLVELIDRHGAEAALPYLLEQARGPSGDACLSAIRALHRRGRPEGVASAIQLLREGASVQSAGQGAYDDPVSRIAVFLIGTGSGEAIRAVFEAYSKLQPWIRHSILGEADYAKALDQDSIDALEAGLIDALDDEERSPASGMVGDKSYDHPPLGDFAAYALSVRWGLDSEFSFQASAPERARFAVRLKNRFRARRGEPLLPEPPTSDTGR